MKKKIRIFIIILLMLVVTSCTDVNSPTTNYKQESYNLALEKGYDGTYTEWCQLIKEIDASLIEDIEINNEQELVLVLNNEEEVNLGITLNDARPSYQGMTAEKINQDNKVSKKHRNLNYKFKDSIDEFLDIMTSEKVEYYASKGEKFNIVVHLFNPKEYEILSFTLNGRKYQAYEFKDGSTSTELIIEVTSDNNPGIFEYTIDAIKYVDKTIIKDVKMDGEKTIRVGVKYENTPKAILLDENINRSTFELSIDIKDENNLINLNNGLYFFLFDGVDIIYNQKLKLGINNIKYEELIMGTNYEYMIVGVYDDYSGLGRRSVSLESASFKTLDGVHIDDLNITKTSISFSSKKRK